MVACEQNADAMEGPASIGMKPRVVTSLVVCCVGMLLLGQAPPRALAAPALDPLLQILGEELDYSVKRLRAEDGTKPYYLSYAVTDISTLSISGSLGALHQDDRDRSRLLDVDLRVGDYELDSTRQIRGGPDGGRFGRAPGVSAGIALENDPLAIKNILWQATDRAFKSAVERFQRVKTDLKTTVEEESKTHDFSREKPSVYQEPDAVLELDRAQWAQRVRNVSRLALKHPQIYESSVSLVGSAENRTQATSEGSRLKTGTKRWRVIVSASTKADDGMELDHSFIYNAATEAGLPSEQQMLDSFQAVLDMVLALRAAPVVEPYTGPAILLNRASGVFFHEIFGHRIEGHRQKDVEEGQTFTKMVGKPILPEFLSVTDDPTQARFAHEDLRGFYRYDDEGIPASRVNLVERGVLRTFLLSRSPVEGFTHSNGHGRRQPGRQVVSRQGNLMVQSAKAVSFPQLSQLLLDECRKQNKPYGYLFEDITGGFTTTARGGPQAFKVLPVVVWRVYADGRTNELVRGVDIVGTPLACFSKILATGDDPAVFNGTCGAESGWVPVSAVSPSILVEQIEIEKRERSQDRLPILPPPTELEHDS
jgi:predicted Zn-dependent protease